jgi:hypothetical protein
MKLGNCSIHINIRTIKTIAWPNMLNKIILKRFPKADENKKPPIKYTELIIGVVSRNNNSAIPTANNYIRHKYGLPLIPDHLPDYKNVEHGNLKNIF